ncbi:MAG: hypothetical protein LBB48_02495 [Treponema sp.]|nr:hypothetical protein [Treponema sp.]
MSKDPRKSTYGGGANPAGAKAVYGPPGGDKFNKSEILRAVDPATIRRMEGRPSVLAARDAAAIDYDGGRETGGM